MTTKNTEKNITTYHRHGILLRAAIIVVGGILLMVFIYLIQNQVNHAIKLFNTPERAIALQALPVIETANLTDTQKKIVTLLKQEYATLPAGTKYTEGANEPWCADFVSWIMNEAGVPLLNKDNGSWRVEDTPPLVEYYKSVGLFEAAGSGYDPKVGDIAIYQKPSPFGSHTNIVIKNDSGAITTVGGNESNTIRIRVYTPSEDAHFLGYGKLPQADTSESLKKLN
jgi:hypothetical protein